MNKFNWVAQDEDGCIYTYDKKPECSPNGNWWRVTVSNSYHSRITRDGTMCPNWRESLIDLSKNDYIIKDGILMATRKHAALIHAWADGAEIQFKDGDDEWEDTDRPNWHKNTEYRIKPATQTVKFRNYFQNCHVQTLMSGDHSLPPNTVWVGDWQEVEIEL